MEEAMDNWPYSPENDDDSPDADAGSSDMSMDDADSEDFGPATSPEKPQWGDEGEMAPSTPAMMEKPKKPKAKAPLVRRRPARKLRKRKRPRKLPPGKKRQRRKPPKRLPRKKRQRGKRLRKRKRPRREAGVNQPACTDRNASRRAPLRILSSSLPKRAVITPQLVADLMNVAASEYAPRRRK
jgi:hypothetical protein